MSFDFLRTLCSTPGVPGHETAFRSVVEQELKGHGDERHHDIMGSFFVRRKGTSDFARKIMIAAHMDEIGFVVRYINPAGFIYLQPLGGFDPRTLIAQRVKIYGKEVVPGIVGIKAAHFSTPEERAKVTQVEDLFVDIGLPVEQVKELVTVGDMVTMDKELIEMGNFYCGKTLDDRVGVYVMIEAFKRFNSSHDHVWAVATVQEEIGLRGAKSASYSLQPDIGIAIDITIAADQPGVDERDHCVKMGQGVGIKILDTSAISHPGLVRFMRELAVEKGIKHQMEILPKGGTDAGGMQLSRGGIPVITLSIPNRYTHSTVECVHKDDVEATIQLLVAFLEESHRFTA